MKATARRSRAQTQPASIVTDVSELKRREHLEEAAKQLGTFDNVMTLEELLRLRETE